MPLGPGSRLGPYEILQPIGAGGMGEVHRARHLKLGRDVAIKVLPTALAAYDACDAYRRGWSVNDPGPDADARLPAEQRRSAPFEVRL